MIPSLSRFGASLPAYSTNLAFTATTENSKALGVSSRANTQRQGFSIFTLATMAYATGKKNYEVGFNARDVLNALNRIVNGNSVCSPVFLSLVSSTQPGSIVRYLKKHFESVFSNKDNPLTVLQGWLSGKGGKHTAPVGEETLGAYIEDCQFYADLLSDTTKLTDWVKDIEANLGKGQSLTPTEQRRWDSYKIWLNLELKHRNTTAEKQARGQLFTNLRRTLEGIQNAVPAK
ncbi:MAG: hypothetical protein ACK551_06675 [Vampirovibrionales bacterium]